MGNRGSCLIYIQDDMNNDGIIFGSEVLNSNIDDNQNCIVTSPKVVKKYGALWYESSPDCNVIDTTGAGDGFIRGFLSAIWGYSLG